MKHLFKRVVKLIVDALLRLVCLPTYTELIDECKSLIMSDHAFFGHDGCERFENIQRLLRRSL